MRAKRYSTRVLMFRSATAQTLPPLPPSPPSGPPRGTNFSRRKLTQPLPPRPPSTKMVSRSTNTEWSVVSGPETALLDPTHHSLFLVGSISAVGVFKHLLPR